MNVEDDEGGGSKSPEADREPKKRLWEIMGVAADRPTQILRRKRQCRSAFEE